MRMLIITLPALAWVCSAEVSGRPHNYLDTLADGAALEQLRQLHMESLGGEPDPLTDTLTRISDKVHTLLNTAETEVRRINKLVEEKGLALNTQSWSVEKTSIILHTVMNQKNALADVFHSAFDAPMTKREKREHDRKPVELKPDQISLKKYARVLQKVLRGEMQDWLKLSVDMNTSAVSIQRAFKNAQAALSAIDVSADALGASTIAQIECLTEKRLGNAVTLLNQILKDEPRSAEDMVQLFAEARWYIKSFNQEMHGLCQKMDAKKHSLDASLQAFTDVALSDSASNVSAVAYNTLHAAEGYIRNNTYTLLRSLDQMTITRDVQPVSFDKC